MHRKHCRGHQKVGLTIPDDDNDVFFVCFLNSPIKPCAVGQSETSCFLLSSTGCHLVFVPSQRDIQHHSIYPQPPFTLPTLSKDQVRLREAQSNRLPPLFRSCAEPDPGARLMWCFSSHSAACHPGLWPLHPADWWGHLWLDVHWHCVSHGCWGDQLVRKTGLEIIIKHHRSTMKWFHLFIRTRVWCTSVYGDFWVRRGHGGRGVSEYICISEWMPALQQSLCYVAVALDQTDFHASWNTCWPRGGRSPKQVLSRLGQPHRLLIDFFFSFCSQFLPAVPTCRGSKYGLWEVPELWSDATHPRCSHPPLWAALLCEGTS